MTLDEARRILGLSGRFSMDDVDQVYAEQCRLYTRRCPHLTDPRERDVAVEALGFLHEAYRTLTGRQPPLNLAPVKPRAGQTSKPIPTVTLSGQRRPQPTPSRPVPYRAGGTGQTWRPVQRARDALKRWFTKERIVAAAIAIGMVVFSVLMIATAAHNGG